MSHTMKRRDFLKLTGISAVTVGSLAVSPFPAPVFSKNANSDSKLNIACIGISNRGGANVDGVMHENIVAICDVDRNYLEAGKKRFPNANAYQDFRKMYDEMADKIDAVVVSTTDHTHAPAALMGMKLGKHCYCEKPLAHRVAEVRQMIVTTKEKNLVTQMGTQIHAEPNYRRVVELIQTGTIGPIRDVHVWCNSAWGGREYTLEGQPVPESLDWDLWLGPAKVRPYHKQYFGGSWRCFWEFGNGAMGDMGCHYMDLPFWALGLRHPLTVEASCATKPDPEMAPANLEVRYTFPATEKNPAISLSWQDGNRKPDIIKKENLPSDWGSGVVFVGEKGLLMADYTRHRLFPEEKFKDFTPPAPFIPDSIGHHKEWTEACKNGGPTTCHFDYSGTLAEAVLLGPVAFKTGKKLEWDPVSLKAVNCPEADQYLKKEYRKGWEI